jgi:anti-sigma factor RsiW
VTDQHPGDDQLLDLALGDINDPEQERLLRHFAICQRCRAEYDAVAATVDGTLAAAPRVEPTPGFDRTVLDAMGMGVASEADRGPHPRKQTLLLVAAVAVIALVLGVGGALVVTDLAGDTDSQTAPAGGAALRTGEGEQVGVVTPSRVEGEPVIVVDVTDGAAGKYYECRLRLADGRGVPAGDWVMESPEATWVIPVPDGTVVAVELVTRSGAVWSSARL